MAKAKKTTKTNTKPVIESPVAPKEEVTILSVLTKISMQLEGFGSLGGQVNWAVAQLTDLIPKYNATAQVVRALAEGKKVTFTDSAPPKPDVQKASANGSDPVEIQKQAEFGF